MNVSNFQQFCDGMNKSKAYKVSSQGAICISGIVYSSSDLLPYKGQYIKAIVDPTLEADAICFELFSKKFITNAGNDYLWSELTKECGLT